MTFLRQEQLDRMDSLANLAALFQLDATARILYKNLEEEGFDRQEILEYIRLQIEGAIPPQ